MKCPDCKKGQLQLIEEQEVRVYMPIGDNGTIDDFNPETKVLSGDEGIVCCTFCENRFEFEFDLGDKIQLLNVKKEDDDD